MFPSGPKARLCGFSNQPVSAAVESAGPTTQRTNAPVVPSYSAIPKMLVYTPRLTTNRLPFGPHANPHGPSNPPLPDVTKSPTNAPVTPSNCTILLLRKLDT